MTIMGEAAHPGKSATVRRAMVLIAAVAAPLVGYLQMALGWGLDPQQFSDAGDETLRAEGYAFAIWGLIYLGLVVYGLYQLLPSTQERPLVRALGWPSFLVLVALSAWVMAAAADMRWMTVIIISVAAVTMAVELIYHRAAIAQVNLKLRMLVVWPLALLGGWLGIASVINLLTVLTAEGLIGPQAGVAFASAGIVAAVVIAVMVAWRSGVWVYAAPIAWGLVAVYVAETQDGDPFKATLALLAAVAVAIVTPLVVFGPARLRGLLAR